jgi:hypothetical protein
MNVILIGHGPGCSTTLEGEFSCKPMTEGALALKGEGPLYSVNTGVKKKWPDQWGKKA